MTTYLNNVAERIAVVSEAFPYNSKVKANKKTINYSHEWLFENAENAPCKYSDSVKLKINVTIPLVEEIVTNNCGEQISETSVSVTLFFFCNSIASTYTTKWVRAESLENQLKFLINAAEQVSLVEHETFAYGYSIPFVQNAQLYFPLDYEGCPKRLELFEKHPFFQYCKNVPSIYIKEIEKLNLK